VGKRGRGKSRKYIYHHQQVRTPSGVTSTINMQQLFICQYHAQVMNIFRIIPDICYCNWVLIKIMIADEYTLT
jgi:hypothetical protein